MKEFSEEDGILYYLGRLDKQSAIETRDIDIQIFYDHEEFAGKIPVIRPESQIFFSYLIHVHTKLNPHTGVEFTTKTILKKMYPVGKFRHIIKKVRRDCTRCRMVFRKTCELEMAKQNQARLMITPVFYNIMIRHSLWFLSKTLPKSKEELQDIRACYSMHCNFGNKHPST